MNYTPRRDYHLSKQSLRDRVGLPQTIHASEVIKGETPPPLRSLSLRCALLPIAYGLPPGANYRANFRHRRGHIVIGVNFATQGARLFSIEPRGRPSVGGSAETRTRVRPSWMSKV